MTRHPLRAGAVVGFGALVVAAAVAPAVAFDAASARGGAPRAAGVDLVVASAVVGVPYAVYLCRRLTASRTPVDGWLAGIHALIVLALAASALPAAVLHASARLHARVVDAEWPVLVAWSAVIAVAVVLAEGARRASLRWLAGGRERAVSSSSSD